MAQNEPKWTSEQALDKGKQAVELTGKYRSDLENRFKPGEIELLQTSVAEMESAGKPGQSEALVGQKAQTLNKGETAKELQEEIITTRGQVKAANPSSDILMNFGVGTSASANNQSQLIAASNMVISGFNLHQEWAQKEAGILEEDIEAIQALRNQLIGADGTLEQKKFARKAKTVNKNTLQRTIEDLVTKTSAIGVKVFRKKDKAIVPLFEALIPGSSGGSSDTQEEPTPEPAAAGA